MWKNQTDQSQYQSSEQVPPALNHGAHELFDVQETMKSLIGAQNQFTYWKPQIMDGQLKEVAEKQHMYLINTYNTLLEAFQTGQAPAQATYHYEMKLIHDFTFGMK